MYIYIYIYIHINNIYVIHSLCSPLSPLPFVAWPRHALEDDGKTVIFVAIDQRPVLLLALADTVKSEAAQSIRALQRMGREAGVSFVEHMGYIGICRFVYMEYIGL